MDRIREAMERALDSVSEAATLEFRSFAVEKWLISEELAQKFSIETNVDLGYRREFFRVSFDGTLIYATDCIHTDDYSDFEEHRIPQKNFPVEDVFMLLADWKSCAGMRGDFLEDGWGRPFFVWDDRDRMAVYGTHREFPAWIFKLENVKRDFGIDYQDEYSFETKPIDSSALRNFLDTIPPIISATYMDAHPDAIFYRAVEN